MRSAVDGYRGFHEHHPAQRSLPAIFSYVLVEFPSAISQRRVMFGPHNSGFAGAMLPRYRPPPGASVRWRTQEVCTIGRGVAARDPYRTITVHFSHDSEHRINSAMRVRAETRRRACPPRTGGSPPRPRAPEHRARDQRHPINRQSGQAWISSAQLFKQWIGWRQADAPG
jgi:hypothetical protein